MVMVYNHSTIHDGKIFLEIAIWYNLPHKSLEGNSESCTNRTEDKIFHKIQLYFLKKQSFGDPKQDILRLPVRNN